MYFVDIARGPVLFWSIVILVVGVLWRLAGILLLPRKPDYSTPRGDLGARVAGAFGTIARRSWPYPPFARRVAFSTLNGYVFHIGLAIVVFFYEPHILFIQGLTGASWPALPNGVVYFVGGVTLASLFVALVRRLTHPVLRMLSNLDDYFSWFVTAAPVATGLMAVAHYGARYEILFAAHIFAAALLFIWLPFGKLMHTFFFALTRGTEGALFARKGAKS